MGTNGKLQQASMDFAIKLIRFYEQIECKAFLKNQLARAGTSIGANIHESTYAESPEDFIHKLGIALKECNETEYWLNIVAEICPDLKKETLQLKPTDSCQYQQGGQHHFSCRHSRHCQDIRKDTIQWRCYHH
jgi:four helix bundle protein